MGRRLPMAVAALLLLLASMGVLSQACKEAERTALLKFKHYFTIYDYSFGNYTPRLDSWVGEDCCSWEGVGCDNVTTHVIKLDLRAGGNIHSGHDGEVNPCLLELKYLSYLDLSCNSFWSSKFPVFLGSMRQLQYLNLSHTHLSGKVAQNLGNLTKLVSLDLNTKGFLETDSLEWASKLKNLQYLDLSGIDLSQALYALNIVHHLPSLSVLNLVQCRLGNSHLVGMRNTTLSSTTLQHLDLSQNRFIGAIPSFIQNLSAIRFLDLSSNNYSGFPIPSWLGSNVELRYLNLGSNYFSDPLIPNLLQNLSLLTHLDLSTNQFSSSILSGLVNKEELTYLSLQKNHLTGPFPLLVQNMSSLTSLDLSYNQFSSSVPSWSANRTYPEYLFLSNNLFNRVDRGVMNIISSLCELTYLDLSNNQLQEDILEFPANFSRCSRYELRYLSLRNNNLSGQLPTMKYLSSLERLDLSQNNFEVIPASFGEQFSLVSVNLSCNKLSVLRQMNLANLSSLREFDISSNSLDLDISSDWLPPFQLDTLKMLPCKINTQFPKWLLSQKYIFELDLSHTGLFGSLPINIGDAMSSLLSLRLANNSINSSIPRSLCKLTNLQSLDIQHNKLSGKIPDCWENSQILGLELSSNKLSGQIPNTLTKSGMIRLLSLGDNLLEGELPTSLINCSKLRVLDVGKNNLHGVVPSWNGANFTSLQILILRQNRFSGVIPPQLCSLNKLQIIDLASNNLVGTIPPCFSHFEGMSSIQNSSYSEGTKQLSHITECSAKEVIKGIEREYTSVLQWLVNMDLSCNNLVGVIPAQITNLTLLGFLNLSYNHLNGTIPKEIGNMRSLESIYLSFNDLTGSIPESISSIRFLSELNLSFNNLRGQIPTGSQLQTLLDPSIYTGNPGLCGDPLPTKCFVYNIAQPPSSMIIGDDDEEENKHEKMWFYLVIILGFASGFWGVIGVLLVKRRWRHAYFQIAEDLADWLYVRVAVLIAHAKRGT